MHQDADAAVPEDTEANDATATAAVQTSTAVVPADAKNRTEARQDDVRAVAAGSGHELIGRTPEGRKLFPWFFLGLLLFSFYLLYYLMQPFLHSIILACVFTAIAFPFYRQCLRLTKQKKIPAALIVLLCIAILVALFIVLFVSGLIPQAKTTIPAVNQWLAGTHLGELLENYLRPFVETFNEHFPEFELSLEQMRGGILTFTRSVGQSLLSSASSLVGNTLMFFAHLLLIMLIMFFLFIDGEDHLRRLAYLFPMKPTQTAVVIESLRRMSRAVLVGGFCVAALQGIAGGIGFAIVGIPPLFWGTVMAFAALVPVLGTSLVWGPAVIFLCIMDEYKSAIFLTVWCGIGVTSIDSIVRPLLLRDGAKVPVLFLFMAILGGVNVFGMLGLLYGPLILGLAAVMLHIYAEEYNEILQGRLTQKP